MEVNELSKNAMGGTELMLHRLHSTVNPDLLKEFQIIPSRVREIDATKLRIYWAHDLPGDPEATAALGDRRWERFHMIVFVSNWQMQRFIDAYELPWSRCTVLHNAIEPIVRRPRAEMDAKVHLVYHTTPHRGLNVLLPVFEKLYEDDKQIDLHVYSSFGIYGWPERDKEYEELFEFCRTHEGIEYHGAKPNEEVRNALPMYDIFAYPSTWPETSCLALIEAMSAGLLCVHSNYGALYETAGNFTFMYQMQEDPTLHASHLFTNLKSAVEIVRNGKGHGVSEQTKGYADAFYNWSIRATQWEALLKSLLARNLDRAVPAEQFVYKR